MWNWVWMIFGLLVGAAIGVFILYQFQVKTLKDKLQHTNNELSKVRFELQNERNNSNLKISQLNGIINKLKRDKQSFLDENIKLGQEIDRYKADQIAINKKRTKEISLEPAIEELSQAPEKPTTLYADAIIDDYFVKVREVPSVDSVFVLHLNGDTSADFSIYQSAFQRIQANPSFLEGCEKQILGDTMHLDIVSEGSAQLEVTNNKWKVINKLKVIIK